MLKDYIVISNNADKVSRISLEKLGFSTKRNDANTIGQFGSGIKYAPIAAIRNNLEWFFTGHDDSGPFTLEYISQKEDGIDCIAYKYGDYIKSSSFTLEAGILSWEDSFQILREPIANAIDGSKMTSDGWYNVFVVTIDTEDEESLKKMQPREGTFSVWITASPELMDIIKNYDLYFSNNRDPILDNSYGKLFKKIDSNARFYCHGVLIKEDKEHSSVYDYQFNNIPLNEERTIKSMYDLETKVTHMICSGLEEDILTKYIYAFSDAKEDQKLWELTRLANQNFRWYISESTQSLWKKVWNKEFGEKTIMINSVEATSSPLVRAIRLRKYDCKLIENNTAYNLFKEMGIKTTVDILSDEYHYDISDNLDDFPKLQLAMRIASKFEPGLLSLNKQIGILNSKDHDVLGMLINSNKENEKRIVVEKSHASSSTIQEIIATLIHEYDHYSSGFKDSSDFEGRSFRDLADKRIGNLIYSSYQEDILKVNEDGVCISYEDIGAVGGMKYQIEYSEILSKYILKIGKLSWLLSLTKTPNKFYGICVTSDDGELISIPLDGSVTIEKRI